MSSTGVVEHLDKTPERWAFLLRAADRTAVNIELRGQVVGTLADGHEIELLESRTIAADEVVVARRLRNLTLGSTVTARQPGRGSKVVAYLVPQSIWTPIGGMGAAVIGYVTAGTTDQDAPSAQATPTPTMTATATEPPVTSAPGTSADDDGIPTLAIVLVAVLLGALVVAFVVRRLEPVAASPKSVTRTSEVPRETVPPASHKPPPPAARTRAGGRVAWFAFVVVAGALVGVVLNVVIT